jgi:hypothetical protein
VEGQRLERARASRAPLPLPLPAALPTRHHAPMPTLLDPAECERTLQRLGTLTADSKPLWGRMNAAQMLAHCRVAMEVAQGKMQLKRMWLGFLIGPLVKRMVVGPKPFQRNGPTAPEFRMTGEHDFATERKALEDTLRAFQAGGAAGISKEPHPFFGKMTTGEWETLQWKHVDHHLQQFGA